MTSELKNGTDISREYNDECPVHGTPEKKAYTFGWNDAEVITFQGCSCAVCNVMGGWNDAFYYDSYSAAAGKAKMASKMAATW